MQSQHAQRGGVPGAHRIAERRRAQHAGGEAVHDRHARGDKLPCATDPAADPGLTRRGVGRLLEHLVDHIALGWRFGHDRAHRNGTPFGRPLSERRVGRKSEGQHRRPSLRNQ